MNDEGFNPRVFLKNLDVQDFLSFGLDQVAYIRQTNIDNQDLYSIHAADGTRLFVVENYDEAVRAIHIHDLDATTLQ